MSIPLYEPLYTLKKVAENIWIADGELIHMNFVAFHVPFSTRMTIVRLADGTLWCHSPIKPEQKLLRAIDQLGKVRHLISPNKIHYAYISAWQKIYPDALAWSSPGVEARARSQKIPVQFDQPLTDQAPNDWSAEIEQLIFKGSRVVEEVVFFHKKSRTLILTDLIENFESERTESYFWKHIQKIAGISAPNGKAPLDFRLTFIGQKAQARQSLARMLAWQPEKMILAHGQWYEKNGTAELKRSFSWLLR